MEKDKIKIFIIQRIFSTYRKFLFDELNKKYNLTVLHTNLALGIKQESSDYSRAIKFTKFGKKDTTIFLKVIRIVFLENPDVIIHEFAIGIFSLPLVMLICRLKGIKLILWSHGYDRKKGFFPKKSWTDKYRLFLMRKANAVILYGNKDKHLLSNYINSNKIFVAPNTLETNNLLKIRNRLAIIGRDVIKKNLKFNKKYNITYIGRMIALKQPNKLIELYEHLKIIGFNSVGIHFIGDGEMLNSLKLEVKNKGYEKDIKFYGTISNDETNGKLLYSSDLAIIPKYVGLSVVHAFSFNCPFVTFKEKKEIPVHGPEIDYIINNKTGFLIEKESIEEMSKTIKTYFEDSSLQTKMRSNVLHFVEKNLNPQLMVDGINNAIEYSIK